MSSGGIGVQAGRAVTTCLWGIAQALLSHQMVTWSAVPAQNTCQTKWA